MAPTIIIMDMDMEDILASITATGKLDRTRYHSDLERQVGRWGADILDQLQNEEERGEYSLIPGLSLRNIEKIVSRRLRKSPYPLIAMDQALASVMDKIAPLPSIERPVNEALIGSVLDEDVVAVEAVPGYRAAILDGYAVIGKKQNWRGKKALKG